MTEYDDDDWDELPKEAKAAAKTLGYNQKKWDNDGKCKYDDYDWDELPDNVRKAAEVLGYNQTEWDKE